MSFKNPFVSILLLQGIGSQVNGMIDDLIIVTELIECVQRLLMSKGSLFLKVLLSSFQLYYSTMILSIGRILRILILTGIMLNLVCSLVLNLKVIILILGDIYRFKVKERAKRPQLAHMPFGFGPRSCIATRFALLEAKMALLELLKKYTFVRAPDTEVHFQVVA